MEIFAWMILLKLHITYLEICRNIYHTLCVSIDVYIYVLYIIIMLLSWENVFYYGKNMNDNRYTTTISFCVVGLAWPIVIFRLNMLISKCLILSHDYPFPKHNVHTMSFRIYGFNNKCWKFLSNSFHMQRCECLQNNKTAAIIEQEYNAIIFQHLVIDKQQKKSISRCKFEQQIVKTKTMLN